MDTQSIQRIKDLLDRSQRIAVAVGKNPSIDEMGSSLALYLSLQSLGKSVSVVSATEPIVEVSNLVGIDKVKTSFEGGGDGADLVVSFPYKEGEIEKVSYTIENGFLNIVVKAGEQGLNFAEHEVKYARGGGGDGLLDLLFVVGTPRLSDIQGSFSIDALKDVTIVNIDNKQENQGYGDVVLVSPRFSSVSEQMTQLMNDLQLDMDIDIAQNLMDGIMFGTENFQSPRTSFLAFEMAGILMRLGAIRSRMPVGGSQQPQQGFQQYNQPQPFGDTQGKQQQSRQQFEQPQQQQNQPRRQQNQQRGQQQHGQDRRQHNQQRGQQQQQQQNQPRGQQQQQYNQPRQQNQQFGQQQQPFGDTQGRQQQQQPRQQFEQPQPFDSAQGRQDQQQQFDQPTQKPQPAPVQEPAIDDMNAPSDWLTPKVYKGSSNV